MPRATRIRHSTHHSSVKLPHGLTKNVNDALPSVDFSEADDGLNAPFQHDPALELPTQQSKKAKQLEKRQAFLQKLEPSTTQMSKSSLRRMKRKAREQLTGGLDDLQSAITTLEKEAVQDESLTTIAASQEETTSKPSAKPGTIGKSGSSTLSKAQRKRVLELERLRHPLILTNSEFSSNPFQTIRTHAENTLLKHGTQA